MSKTLYTDEFSSEGLSTSQCMDKTEFIAIAGRKKLAAVAAERLIERSHFDGALITNVRQEGHVVRVEVILVDMDEIPN